MKIIKLNNLKEMNGSIPLQEYERIIVKTDRFRPEEIIPIILGLYGEVGSIMSASKKYHREKIAYVGYRDAVEEEFGDALWYFSALCRRLEVKLGDIFESAVDQAHVKVISANDHEKSPISQIISFPEIESLFPLVAIYPRNIPHKPKKQSAIQRYEARILLNPGTFSERNALPVEISASLAGIMTPISGALVTSILTDGPIAI